jgi:hypothetical protein
MYGYQQGTKVYAGMTSLQLQAERARCIGQAGVKRPSNARRQRRLERQLGMALFRDRRFEMVLRYALVLLLLLAVVAGLAETFATHDKYYPYNLDVPRKLL